MTRTINFLTLAVITFFLMGCTAQQIQQTLGDYLDTDKLTTEQVANGLKDALKRGVTTGTNSASAVNGFLNNEAIKIPFPPEVEKVADKLRQIGLGSQVDQFVETLNHGAEQAAAEAKPIFVSAITSMTVEDAWGILKGEDDAATQYLNKTTYSQLRAKFEPIIKNALEQTNATKYYGDIIDTYNKIPFVDDVNSDLTAYATDRALAGLFVLIKKEELNIRENVNARTTDLMKKVFAQQD